MWQKIKGLNEQRAQVVTDMQGILKKGEDEKRDLTAEESGQFDVLRAKADSIKAQIDRLEAMQNLGPNAWRGEGPPPRDPIANSATAGGSIPDDVSESRALRADESCVSYLRSRGMAGDAEGLTFGRYVRAMILGPKDDTERRALAEGSDSSGGYTVPSILFGNLVDRLRPATVCVEAGAQIVALTSAKNTFAKVATDPVATWRSENAAVNVSDPTFAGVVFQPKTLATIVRTSRELFEDSINLESSLEMIFVKSFATELDRVALVGASANGEPVGLANMAGVNSISMGTNGGQLTSYGPILDAVQAVETANARVTSLIAHPRTMRQLSGLSDTLNQPLRRPDSLTGISFRSTTGIPVNDTQGTATNASKLFAGEWSRLWIGVRTELRIEVLRDTYAGNLQYGFLAYLRADIQASHENAFAKIVGIIP